MELLVGTVLLSGKAPAFLAIYVPSAILAHPTLYHFNNNLLNTFIEELSLSGLDGIEGIYCTYTPSEERLIRSLAQKHNLLITGGSDFHGENREGVDLGDAGLEYSQFEKIKKYLKR